MRTPTMWRAFLLLLTVLAFSCVSAGARAEPALVVLVRPPQPSAIVHEVITRIRGELAADGFNVLVIDAAPDADPAPALSRVGLQTGAAATLGLIVQPDARRAQVWIVDRMTNKTVMRSLEMPPISARSTPEVLARRSVELLRASLLELLVDAREQAVESPEARAKAAAWAARPRERSRWGVEAGAQIIGRFDGIGAAMMPVGRVRFVLGPPFSARLTLAGLGMPPRVNSSRGSATVSQALALFELVGDVGPQGWLRPSVSLGAGAYWVGTDGSATYPYLGIEDERFVFAADVGAGLALPLTSSFALSLEGHTTLVMPYPVLRFLGAKSVELRNPLLSTVLTLVARL